MILTTSFHTVLWHLRKTNVRWIVWADGVCVNQNDLAERSAHPSIMDDVYRNAKELHVWLEEIEEIQH